MFAPRAAMLAQCFGQTAVVRSLAGAPPGQKQAGRPQRALYVRTRVVRKKTLRDSPVHNDGWCLAGVMSEVQQQLLVTAARNWTQSRLGPQHKALCELPATAGMWGFFLGDLPQVMTIFSSRERFMNTLTFAQPTRPSLTPWRCMRAQYTYTSCL